MTRLTIALAALLFVVSVAPASLARRPERALLTPALRHSRLTTSSADWQRPEAAAEYQVTEQTVILLDGTACRYEDVPAGATILRMEVAPDGKTVLRIYFRSGK
jgi:hypothetical protein